MTSDEGGSAVVDEAPSGETEGTGPGSDQAPAKKRGFRFPTAFTILFGVVVVVWALTFVIHPGTYDYVSCDGGTPKPIPGTFHHVDVNQSFRERLYDLWVSPVNGLYGVRTPAAPIVIRPRS